MLVGTLRYRQKYETNFVSLKSLKKGVGSGVGSGSISILVRGTDPGIRMRIRTKISRIPPTLAATLGSYPDKYQLMGDISKEVSITLLPPRPIKF